jgi:hypothetical protein
MRQIMQEVASTLTVSELLNELDDVLTEETQALTRLDPTAVDATAKRKLLLSESLSAITQPFSKDERLRLAKIRTKLRHNIVLLAHAREYVQVTAKTIVGQPQSVAPDYQPPSLSARLDVRG